MTRRALPDARSGQAEAPEEVYAPLGIFFDAAPQDSPFGVIARVVVIAAHLGSRLAFLDDVDRTCGSGHSRI